MQASGPTPPAGPRPRAGRPASAIRQAAAIVISGALLGVVANFLSPRGIPLVGDFSRGAALANLSEAEKQDLPLEIGAAGVDSALADSSAIVLDARAPEDYVAGHLPGALNLPAEQFDRHYPALADTLKTAPRLIVYCDGGDCELSKQLGEALQGFGHGPVQLFTGGLEAWIEAGKALREGEEP
jgi:rhodanese-related sulfurtransferase